MNILPGIIKSTQTHGNLTLVKVDISNISFTSIVIETPDTVDYLKEGAKINVMFKETEVIISKEDAQISLQNRIPAKVTGIRQGKLLSQISLQYQDQTLYSIITSNAVEQLQLSVGTEVIAMIKTNEVMLSE